MYASVKYWVWLADLLPPVAGHRVYEFFQSPTEAFLADKGRYDLIPGLTRQQKEQLCHSSLDRAELIVEECARKDIRRTLKQSGAAPGTYMVKTIQGSSTATEKISIDY